MDSLLNYGSDDEEPKPQPTNTIRFEPRTICTAPAISTALVTKDVSGSSVTNSILLQQGEGMIKFNPTADYLLAPMVGPAHPFKRNASQFNNNSRAISKSGMGYIEEANIDDYTFDSQFKSYQSRGFALDVSTNEVLGDYKEYLASENVPRKAQQKRKRSPEDILKMEDIGDDDAGPWAPFVESTELQKHAEAIAAKAQQNLKEKESALSKAKEEDAAEPANPTVHIQEIDEEEEKWEKINERKISYTLPPRPAKGFDISETKSTFHGQSGKDYQGRSWVVPPSGVRPCDEDDDHECFIPKKCIKKYTGHTKGVQEIALFPGTGHLLLSASLDGKCKIWEVFRERNVKRTYMGHSEAVRSINMSSNGSEFLSSGFDRLVRLWDVETGQAKGTFTNKKMFYQVRFQPLDNNIFLCAASDNKVYQWDTRTGAVCQEYNYHLQPCNTITFFEGGRKFLTTSDDKKILVWEYDIPVPIKYIQEQDMHSMPAVTVHPNGNYFVGQSMDNTIVTYSCGEKVKHLKNKDFRGHVNAGYACQMGFSPNGQFLVSGDAQGKLHVWDWKSTKPYRKFQAHDGGPCMSALWHPITPSWVVTCGWDSTIKLWD